MTGTDLCVNKPQSVPVIFEPPCINTLHKEMIMMMMIIMMMIIIIIIIIGENGTTSKSFRQYLSNIPGEHEIKELQQTAILGTAHILRKVLM